ncbi:MAG TPA: 4Fe-4S binding protein [Bacillota bacterium]|nr:4Fe-4S binding protein [Bacillota bacterium]
MVLEFEPKTTELEKGSFTIFPGLCKGCGLCMVKCPRNCLFWSDVLGVCGTPTVGAKKECIACGICQSVCPDSAISVEKKGQSIEKP